MNEYKPGDRVRVTVEGAVTYVSNDRTALSIRFDGGQSFSSPHDRPGLTIERLAPPEPIAVAGRVYRDTDGDVGLVRADDDGDLWIYWVTGGEGRLDDMPIYPKTLTQVWPPLDAEQEDALAEPLHTWPPTEPGLWFCDMAGSACRSVEHYGDIHVTYGLPNDPPARVHSLNDADMKFGPYVPIPAPGGAS